MYCLRLAGITYSTLALVWSHYAEVAQGRYAAGIAVAPPATPYLGLHGELCGQLAVHRYLDGDTEEAYDLARRAQANIARSRPFLLETPVTAAVIVALGPDNDAGGLHTALRAYHDATRRRGWGSEASETVALYGAFLAALHEDWELACRLLAAGERGIYGSVLPAHLYFYFRDQIRDALGPQRFRDLRDEGRAMSLAEAVAAALF